MEKDNKQDVKKVINENKLKGSLALSVSLSHDKTESKAEIEANKEKLKAFKDNQKVITKLTKAHSK